jgi:hypothetical protein
MCKSSLKLHLYNINRLALSKMELDKWLEVDNTYISRIIERKKIFKEHGKNVLDYLPSSKLAYKEIIEMCI